MSNRDSFVKAMQEQQWQRAIDDAQWLRERGIVAGKEPGEWRPMGMFQHLRQMLGGTPEGQRQSGEFIGKLPAAAAQEATRAMPMGDIPIRDKRGRVVEWRSREEFEQPRDVYDPVQWGSADPTLLAANLLDPSPGGEVATGLKRGAVLGGSEAVRQMLARVLNVGRKHIKGEAKQALLSRLKQGLLLEDVAGTAVREGETAIGDIVFDKRLDKETIEALGLSRRDVDRLQTLIRRQREAAQKLYERMADPDLPPLEHGLPEFTRVRIAMEGPHPESTALHEVLGHIPEFGAPAQARARWQHFAERAVPDPAMAKEPYENPVYWLQEWAAGQQQTGRYTLKRLREMQEKGLDVPQSLIEQAKLREALEQYGYDIPGLEGVVPKEPLWQKMRRR